MEDASNKTINIKAVVGTKKEGVEEIAKDFYRVRVSAAPEKGKANKRIRELLAKHLGVAKSRIVLKNGAASRQKLFSVELP